MLTIMIGAETVYNLRKMKAHLRMDYSEFARRSIRKARKIELSLSAIEPCSTTGGMPLKFNLKEVPPPSPDAFRRILEWSLENVDYTQRPSRNPAPSGLMCFQSLPIFNDLDGITD